MSRSFPNALSRECRRWIRSARVGVLLSLLGAFGSCGPAEPAYDVGAYGGYVQAFESASAAAGHPVIVTKLRITEEPLAAERISACFHPDSDGASPHIIVNPGPFGELSETGRRLAIFHELGHCILNRAHRDELAASGQPLSLMHSTPVEEADYSGHTGYYQRELFAPADTDVAGFY